MFLFQTARKPFVQNPAQAQPAQGAASQVQPLIPFEKFTPQMKQWLGAVEIAAKDLRNLVSNRTKGLSDNTVYLGPNVIDPSFFYRLTPGQQSYFLPDYTDEEHKAMKHRVPFLKRDMDYMANPANFSGAPDSTLRQRAELINAFKKPEFVREMVSEHEFSLLGRLIYDGRQEGVKNKNILLCIKHFPGGDNISIGAAHTQSTVSEFSLPALYGGPLRAFVDILKNSKEKPPLVMTGHAAYPQAEKELRAKHKNLPTIFSLSLDVPATFSPYMVRGLLRRDLGFQGLVVSDAIGMDALSNYAEKIRAGLPKSQREDYPVGALVFFLSAYAGINHGIGWGEYGPCPDNYHVKKLYDSSQEFRRLFDELALETLFLKVKLMPASLKPAGLPDLGNVSLGDLKLPLSGMPEGKQAKINALKALIGGNDAFLKKLDVLVTNRMGYRPSMYSLENGKDRRSDQLRDFRDLPDQSKSDPRVEAVLDYYSSIDDLWNRGGLLDIKFRTSILENLPSAKKSPHSDEFTTSWDRGISFNMIDWSTSLDPKKSSAPYIDKLFSDPAFKKAYGGMDWNSPEWQSVFAEYLRRLNAGEYDGRPASGIMQYVPKKK